MVEIDPKTGNIRFGDVQINPIISREELEAYSGVSLTRERYIGSGIYQREYLLPLTLTERFKWQAHIAFSGSIIYDIHLYCADIIHHYGDNPKAASIWWKIHGSWVEQATEILEDQLGIIEVGFKLPESYVKDGKLYLTKHQLEMICGSPSYKYKWGHVYRYYNFRSDGYPYDLLTTIWIYYLEEYQFGQNWNGILKRLGERIQTAAKWNDTEGQHKLVTMHNLAEFLKDHYDDNTLYPQDTGASALKIWINKQLYFIWLKSIGNELQYEFSRAGVQYTYYANSLSELIPLIDLAIERRI